MSLRDRRFSENEYNAILKAKKPTAVNPFATMADLTGAGGAGTLAETLIEGNLSGANDILMESTNVINNNSTTAMGVIFTEADTYAYFASDGLWSTGTNAGVFVDQNGYFSLFGDDWSTSFEGGNKFAGYYASEIDFTVYIGEDKGGDGFWRVSLNPSAGTSGQGGHLIGAYDIRTNSGGSSGSPLGLVALATKNGSSNADSGVGADQIAYGQSYLSCNGGNFGFFGQAIAVPRYSSMIASEGVIITSDNLIVVPAKTSDYNTSLSSSDSTLLNCNNTSVIASTLIDLTLQDYVAVLAHSALTVLEGDILDYSTVVENLYVDGKAHFRTSDAVEGFANIPIVAVAPSAPVDGDVWFLSDGGGDKLQVRVSGVTKSVTLT